MWWNTSNLYIWIFNTGRGLSICIRFPNNIGLIYDLGCSEDFSPSDYIARYIVPHLTKFKDYPIGQVVLSHPHVDHIQEIDSLFDNDGTPPILSTALLTCPNDIESDDLAINISRIQRDDNKEIIEKYRAAYEKRKPPLQTMYDESSMSSQVSFEYGIYYLNPKSVESLHPTDDHAYVNGLSLLLYAKLGEHSILIPGDVTPIVFKRILDGGRDIQKRYSYFGKSLSDQNGALYRENGNQRNLGKILEDQPLNIFVTPHHGLESCFCQDFYNIIKGNKPDLNIISDKRHLSTNDGLVSPNYQSSNYSNGLAVNINNSTEKRYSVSTRNGQHILIILSGQGTPSVYLRDNPHDLIQN